MLVLTKKQMYDTVVVMTQRTPEHVNIDPAAHQREIASGIAGSYALAAGAAAAGVVGERLQEEAQIDQAFQQQFAESVGATVTHDGGLVNSAVEFLANAPDMRSLGLSVAVLAAIKMASVADRMRKGAEAPDQNRAMRFVRKTGALALASVAAYGAYKVAGSLTPLETVVAGMGVTGAGIAYMHGTQIQTNRRRA